ncbi:hypothetical protein DYU11_20155 [Fibrisoma montanum]|uniref:YopX protein domain-containing protein n=1 Tax=Fibrisoma montanum TaxID=2305895 RepID=A0A418M3G4_9BACT|nr:YopX family protein [Fibrisoma montanum]RIV20367.1 hypothetical protein DYU11_20155 [Fibrisoma montanum]
MRQLKFRAWDGKVMRYTGTDRNDVLVLTYTDDTGVCDGVKLGRTGDEWEIFGYKWNLYDEANGPVLMQFTGLTDKNGTEIYEGDIVEIWDTELSRQKSRYTVGWNKYALQWYANTTEGDEYGSYSKPLLGQTRIEKTRTEVIGNIYEHPHLLS